MTQNVPFALRGVDASWVGMYVSAWAVAVTASVLTPIVWSFHSSPGWCVLFLGLASAWVTAWLGVRFGVLASLAASAACGYVTCVLSACICFGPETLGTTAYVGIAIGPACGVGFALVYLTIVVLARSWSRSQRDVCARSRIVEATGWYSMLVGAAIMAVALLQHDRTIQVAVISAVALLAGAVTLVLWGASMKTQATHWVREVEAGRVPGFATTPLTQFSLETLEELPRLPRGGKRSLVIAIVLGDELPYRAAPSAPVLLVAP